jgi:TatD DNase family protein
MQLHDTHAHLDILLEHLGLLDAADATLSPEALTQINQELTFHEWVIQPTVSSSNYKRACDLFAHKLETPVYFLLGAHPELVDESFDVMSYMSTVPRTKSPLLVGVGEIGLDYHYTQDSQIIAKQKELFRRHIELANELSLPIIIHCREAFEDVFTILDEYPAIRGKFLIHCFTGNKVDLNNVLSRGGLAAYGGVTTFKNATELQSTVNECPISSFVLETDLPFLAPMPHRGKTCIPSYIKEVGAKIAELKSYTKEEIWNASLVNSKKFFDLSKH